MKVKARHLWHLVRMHFYRSIVRATIDDTQYSHNYLYSINPNYRMAYDKFEQSRSILRHSGHVLT